MSANGIVLANVSVDDTDPSIEWNGPWYSVQGITDDWGNHGPPFLGTSRRIAANGSLTFSFRGRGMSIWGALNTTGTENEPVWDCLFDGQSSGARGRRDPRETRFQSNLKLCSHDSLPHGDHTFELRTTVLSLFHVFWVDQIQYQASFDTDISSSWAVVGFEDARYRYFGDWERDFYGTATWTSNGSFTYKFNGQEIIFGGYTSGNANALDGLATYSLDSGPPVEFRIPANSNTSHTMQNQPYFKITTMEPGDHRLEVVNKGNASTAPLAFAYIYTKNGPTQRDNRGIIGGAVGGGIAAILLAALLCFMIRRRRRREQARVATLLPSVFTTEQALAVPSAESSTDSSSPPSMRGLVASPPAPHHKSSALTQSHVNVQPQPHVLSQPHVPPQPSAPAQPSAPTPPTVPAQALRSDTPPPSYAAL